MYARILKRDLRRRKTMNMILLLFIFLVSMFISSSVNNILSISTAMDNYFEKAGVPDYWLAVLDDVSKENFEEFAKEEDISYRTEDLCAFSAKKVKVEGKVLGYGNTFSVSDIEKSIINVFDNEDQPIQEVKPGEIYVTAILSEKYDIKPGDVLSIETLDGDADFKVAGSTKDALYGSDMIGMTRCLVNPEDYKKLLRVEKSTAYRMYNIFSDQIEEFEKKLNAQNEIMSALSADKGTIQNMYVIDMVIAALLLVVSICLIIISLVILRFAIVFTMKEEFSEIGVMKAIGIKSRQIRGLYAVKYAAIAVVGGIVGFVCGIPFGKMLLKKVSQNVIMENDGNIAISILASLVVVGIVMLFSYLVTRRINKIKPVEAIRKGSTGERFKKKNKFSLGKGHLPTLIYLALNDIVSCFRRFGILLLAFTIGILLVIIPINTANTLKSDHLLTWFAMTECDLCINRDDVVLINGATNREAVERMLQGIRDKLAAKDIPAKVHMECVYRLKMENGDNNCSSLAFSGVGDVTAEEYTYTQGDAPRCDNEVAITKIIAEKLDVEIGDEIKIYQGNSFKKYIVTGYIQTMNNMGEGVRFSEKEKLNDRYMTGFFAAQVRYTDQPDEETKKERKEQIRNDFSNSSVDSAGEYIDEMIGGIASQIDGVVHLVLLVVICINILVTVLMMKSFFASERGEIGMLKAIGFQNHSVILWQSLRIGIILVCATLLAIAVSTPLSHLAVTPVFKMMGAETITFNIVPWEVYVCYPLFVTVVTLFACVLTALGVRKISPAETSNIE